MEERGDLTLLEFEDKLAEQVKQLTELCSNRMMALDELKRAEKHLCDILDEEPTAKDVDSYLSTQHLAHMKECVDKMESDKARRLQQYRNTKQCIDDLIWELELTPDSDVEDLKIICGDESTFMPTASNMQQLQYCFTQLEMKKKWSQNLASELRSQVELLWTQVNISEDSMKSFLMKNAGCSQRCIEALDAEVNRCHDLRKPILKDMIQKTRDEIGQLWAHNLLNSRRT